MPIVKVDMRDLRAASCFVMTGKEAEIRRMLACVYLYVWEDGSYSCVASDSFKLGNFSSGMSPYCTTKNAEAYKRAILANDLKRIPNSLKYIYVDTESDNLTYKEGACEPWRELESLEGNYPNFWHLLNDKKREASNIVALSPVLLADVCKAVRKAYGSKDVYLKFDLADGSNKPVYLSAKDKHSERSFIGLIMPIRF